MKHTNYINVWMEPWYQIQQTSTNNIYASPVAVLQPWYWNGALARCMRMSCGIYWPMTAPSQGHEDAPHSKRSRICNWMLHTGALDTCLAQTVFFSWSTAWLVEPMEDTRNHFEFLLIYWHVLKATQGVEQLMTKKQSIRYLDVFKFFLWWSSPSKTGYTIYLIYTYTCITYNKIQL